MSARDSEKALAWAAEKAGAAIHLAKCRAIVGGEDDPLGREWGRMDQRERGFWLHYARRESRLSRLLWSSIAPEDRNAIRTAVQRAASRASMLLGVPA